MPAESFELESLFPKCFYSCLCYCCFKTGFFLANCNIGDLQQVMTRADMPDGGGCHDVAAPPDDDDA